MGNLKFELELSGQDEVFSTGRNESNSH